MKLRKFRPLFGRLSIEALSISVDFSARVVSTIGESAVTCTSCCTPDTLQRDRHVRRLADRQRDAVLNVAAEALKPDRQLVDAERQQQAAEAAVGIGDQLAGEVRPGVGQRDARARQAAAGFVRDSAFDHAGRRLRLRRAEGGERRCEHQREDDHESMHWGLHSLRLDGLCLDDRFRAWRFDRRRRPAGRPPRSAACS